VAPRKGAQDHAVEQQTNADRGTHLTDTRRSLARVKILSTLNIRSFAAIMGRGRVISPTERRLGYTEKCGKHLQMPGERAMMLNPFRSVLGPVGRGR
jgi:hypothetical protein